MKRYHKKNSTRLKLQIEGKYRYEKNNLIH